MTFLTKTDSGKTRIAPSSIKDAYSAPMGRSDVARWLAYHDGDDRRQTLENMCSRYAVEIVKGKNPTTGEEQTWTAKTVSAKAAAIFHRLFEVVNRMLSNKITGMVASLFDTSKFVFAKDGTVDDQITQDINEERKAGGFKVRFSRADEVSVAVGSCVVLTQVLNDKLNYQAISPDKVWIVFGTEIEADDKKRAVDNLDVEDAYCIVIQLDDERFVAFFARSDMYPQGRRVEYEASEWSAIPEPADKKSSDFLGDDGEVANPLTELQDKHGVYTSPEYPVIVWKGTTRGIDGNVTPIDLAMMETCGEIDLTDSRTSMSANKGARGAWYLTSAAGASTHRPPSFDEGVSELKEGQSALVLSVDASNIEVANKVNNDNAAHLANSYGVPTYEMSVDQATQMPSGQALIIANRALNAFRMKRAEINESEMAKEFEIEKALIGVETGELVGVDVEQGWTVGPYEIEKTRTELLTEAKLEKELAITDNAAIVIKTNPDIETREEAQAYLEELTPVVVSTPQGNTGIGLPGRRAPNA